MLSRGFQRLSDDMSIIIYPIVFNIITFFITLFTIGFPGEPKLSFKLSISVGLPTISSVFDQANSGADLSAGLGALLFTLVIMLISAFAEAGFIGLLLERVRGNKSSGELFLSYANKFWTRMLLVRFLIFVLGMVSMVFAMLLGLLGMLIWIVAFITLRILYIYWEFSVVAEDLDVFEALDASREAYNRRTPATAGAIWSIIFINLLAALFVNALWSPMIILFSIFGYAYFATGAQLALMDSYDIIGSQGA